MLVVLELLRVLEAIETDTILHANKITSVYHDTRSLGLQPREEVWLNMKLHA